MMDSWILQGGHPIVRVGSDDLSQAPFSYGPPRTGGPSAIGGAWQVPIITRTLEGTPGQRVLLGADPVVRPDGEVVNAGGWGVYRLTYDDLGPIARRLGELDPLERFNLFADTWALVLAGRVELATFVALAGDLAHEDEPGIFSLVAAALGLCDRAASNDDRPTVQEAARSLLGPRSADLGWDRRGTMASESHPASPPAVVSRDDRGRPGRASRGGPKVRRRRPHRPDIEAAVWPRSLPSCGTPDYDTMVERYRRPANPQEELRYLTALASFPDPDLGRRTFELARTEVRTQNGPYLVATLLSRAGRTGGLGGGAWPTGRRCSTRFPINSHTRMVDGVRGLAGDPALAEDVGRFLAEHPLAGRQRSIDQTLDAWPINVSFTQTYGASWPRSSPSPARVRQQHAAREHGL